MQSRRSLQQPPPAGPLRPVCLNRISAMTMPPAATLSYLFLRSAALCARAAAAASAVACKTAANAADASVSTPVSFLGFARRAGERRAAGNGQRLEQTVQGRSVSARCSARSGSNKRVAFAGPFERSLHEGQGVAGGWRDSHAAATLLTFIQDSLANAGATRPLAIGCVCAAR